MWQLLACAGAAAVCTSALAAPGPSHVVRGPVKLSERDGIRLTAYISEFTSPLPTDRERRERQPCIRLVRLKTGLDSSLCRDTVPSSRPLVEIVANNGRVVINDVPNRPKHQVLFGLAVPRVASVSVTLGSGRRVVRRTSRLPAKLHSDERWFRVDVPFREAARSLAIRDRHGRRLKSYHLGLAPQASAPRLFRQSFVDSQRIPRTGRPVTPGYGPAGVTLRAVDAGQDLCLVLGESWDNRCAAPPAEPGEARLLGTWVGDAGLAAGVVLRDVASVVLTPASGGAPTTVETEPMRDYGGAWAPYLRTFSVLLHPQDNYDVKLLDAAGGEVGSGGVAAVERPGDPEYPKRVRVRARRGPTVTIGYGDDCDFAVLDRRGRPTTEEECIDDIAVASACKPRAVIVWLIMLHRRELRAITREGSVLRPRIVSIPERQAGVLAVPTGEHLKEIRWRVGSRYRTRDLGRVPSAREQCGFTLLSEDIF